MDNYIIETREQSWTYGDSKNLGKIPGLLAGCLVLLLVIAVLGVVGYMRIEQRTDKLTKVIVHELVVKPTHKIVR